MGKNRKSIRFYLVRRLIRLLRIKEFYGKSGASFWEEVRRKRSRRGSAPSLLQRWLIFLSRFQFETIFLPGRKQPVFTLNYGKWNRRNIVLYLHGGGNVDEATRTHWFFLMRLAKRTGARIVAPEYPLAPDNSCENALEMIREVYVKLLETFSSESIFLMGDSAGGGLTLSSAMFFRERGLPMPRNLIMISPALEFGVSDPEFQAEIPKLEKRDPMLSFGGFPTILEKWRGTLPPGDWRAEPLWGNLENLPPMTIFIGTDDILSLGTRTFLKKVMKVNERYEKREKEKAGKISDPPVRLRYREFPEMFHCWLLFPIPEACAGQKEIWEIILANKEF